MATSDRPSQGYLRELAELPPPIRDPKPRRTPEQVRGPQSFWGAERRGTPLDRLLAGNFQRRLVVLLGAVLLTVFIVTVVR